MWSTLFGSSEPQYVSTVQFKINGNSYSVESKDVTAKTTLNTYLREVAQLTGTKFMCNEGGCGTCVVAATVQHPVTKERATFAVNSCLTPVLACDGWEVTTVEGIGDRRTGYHRAQATLAHFNGTQCGFCSPGMVMNMYSLLEGGKAPTMAEVENSFGGNICRCTGYRSILDAFKALSVDATPELKAACVDIEDLYKVCPNTGAPCHGSCGNDNQQFVEVNLQNPLRLEMGEFQWFKVRTSDELISVFKDMGDKPYKLVAGNTGEGVYPSEGIEVFIDIRDVPDLRTTSKDTPVSLGGNVTLTEAMHFFDEASKMPGYAYLKDLASHIDKIANVPVRNAGTVSGNLSLKKANPQFPSDMFTILEAVGAKLNIMDVYKTSTKTTLMDYLQMDMKKKIILSIELPKLTSNHRFRSFKITPRAQNAHAYVNAAFLVKFEDTTNWKVVDQPRVVFGGINPQFVHATNLETFLMGKRLLEASTIKKGLEELDRQLIPDNILPDASPEFRKKLASALFYKFLLGLDPNKVSPEKRSGATELERPLSSGKQEFDTHKKLFPLNEPIPKMEAVAQCSGEAEFVNDLPVSPGELHGALVLATQIGGKLENVDTALALMVPGVVAFYSHSDIPQGLNNYTPRDIGHQEVDEIFCSGQVKYAGQAVGMIVAKTRAAALEGAERVKIKYSPAPKPVLSVNEVLRSAGDRISSLTPENLENSSAYELGISANSRVIKGTFEIGKQYHLTMETQTCLVVPKEDSYDVFSATQFLDHVQTVVARILEVPSSQVNVSVRRLGGGYGAKITRPAQIAAACAVAVKKLNVPVRLVLPLTDNMELAGKRFGLRNEYEVTVDDKGKVEKLKATLYQDSGCNFNDSPLRGTVWSFRNCYDGASWQVEGKEIRTDTASNTWCRAPGTTEGVAFIEEIMENIASTLKLDPLAVRLVNMKKSDNILPAMIDELKTKADYDKRRKAIDDFNAVNRWKKRGIAIVPMKYDFGFWGRFNALVSVYKADGSVAVTHGGVEMGQGMNTKVAQVAAHILGAPLKKISVKPSTTLTAPNSMQTGGSIGSEAVAYATMMACKDLIERMKPFKEKSSNATWEELVRMVGDQNVNLNATYMFTNKDNVKDYEIYGAAVGEVELDILTGDKQVLRVDLVEDVGQSLSPLIDVGQIEGAFVMGMGYWLSEELIHDPETGRLLNTRTWNYKPPGAKDIPVDFRVYFKKNADNPNGVLQSKATGEPPLNLSIVVLFALQNAVNAARKNAGDSDAYAIIKPPATNEQVFLASKTDLSHLTL